MPRKNNAVPHTPFLFVSQCQNKRRFKNEKEAIEAAEYQMLIKPTLELSVYKCEFCSGWHLTRQSR